jgi:hypothetical protein
LVALGDGDRSVVSTFGELSMNALDDWAEGVGKDLA